MTLRVEPLMNYCLVAYLPQAAPSSLLVIPQHDSAVRRATILATGPDVLDQRIGDTVLLTAFVGVTVGDDQALVPETSILATIGEAA